MSKVGEIYYHLKNKIDQVKEKKHIKSVINSFIIESEASSDQEIKSIQRYYKNGGLSPFPYNLEQKYQDLNIKILVDGSNGLSYIIHKEKKLFFPRNFDNNKIKNLYKGLVIEQDKDCPHCYLQNDFEIVEEDILIDVGCADAMFSLENIHSVKKLYLFETNSYWIEALNATFQPWENKVEIINTFVSNSDAQNHTTLDKVIGNIDQNSKIFIKMDVEGSEMSVLEGSIALLNKANNIKLAIAAYHKQNDNTDLSIFLNNLNYITKNTDGYMLFYYDKNITSPFLRKCIIQAQKNL